MLQLNTAVNDAIREIFVFIRWESIRNLRILHSYESISEIFHSPLSDRIFPHFSPNGDLLCVALATLAT